MLLHLFQPQAALFRTGWFMEPLVTHILMIVALRTRRHLFASRPQRAVAGRLSALTVALPFMPEIGRWFEFVHPPVLDFAFLGAVARPDDDGAREACLLRAPGANARTLTS